MARGNGYDQVMALWGIQESLLQAYRSIFITAESVVFAVAAAITTSNPISALILTFLGLVLLYMWHRVTSNRAKDVSFVQWLLARAEEGESIEAPLKLFKDFQGCAVITIGERSVWRMLDRGINDKVNDRAYVSLTKSPSRHWMEVKLPAFFGVLWVMIALLAFGHVCPNAV
jgi:hypothetical protein